MRILLGSVWSPRWGHEQMPILAIYQLAGLARAHGHQVEIIDPRGSRTPASRAQELDRYDLIGLNANSFTWAETLQWLKVARAQFPDVPIVLGGVHPSFCDEHCLRVSKANWVVRFEGEDAFIALCEYMEGKRTLDSVPNLTRLDGEGNVVRHPQAPLISARRLEELPPPAFDLVPEGVYQFAPVESARGCSFNCWFCGVPYRRSWRGYSTQAVLNAVDHAMAYSDRFVARRVFFADDCFSIHPKRTTELFDALRTDNRGASYSFELRIRDVMRNDIIAGLDGVPCNTVQVGIECGYDEGLDRIEKCLTTAEVLAFADRVRDMSFHRNVWWSFVLGFPWETTTEIKKSVEFAYRAALAGNGSEPHFATFTVLPGSRAHTDGTCVKQPDDAFYDSATWDDVPYQFCSLTPAERIDLDEFTRRRQARFHVMRTYSGQGLGMPSAPRAEPVTASQNADARSVGGEPLVRFVKSVIPIAAAGAEPALE